MSDMILRRMPRLPLGGPDAIKAFPVLAELKKSHDKIKADLDYLLSHHEAIPALHEVHPRDLYVAGRAWRTFLLKIWGHEIKENTAAVPDTYAAICRIPGVHTALFSILAGGGAEIEPHRGSAAGVIRFHYPLIVPAQLEKCWIEIGGHHFFWKEGEPLVFDDTREHWVKNQTDQTRVVLIIDFNADMPFPVNLYTALRYNLIRHCDRGEGRPRARRHRRAAARAVGQARGLAGRDQHGEPHHVSPGRPPGSLQFRPRARPAVSSHATRSLIPMSARHPSGRA